MEPRQSLLVYLFLLLLSMQSCQSAGIVRTTPVMPIALNSIQSQSGLRRSMESPSKRKQRIQLMNFFAGGISGSVSSILTIPLEVVKTQLQSSRMSGKENAFTVAQKIFATDGPKGFFKGIVPLVVGILPTRAIYFWAYSSSKEAFSHIWGPDSALNHLASAFAAGITSNTITNPLWMVKTRFQIMADPAVGQKMYSNYGQVIRAIWKEGGVGGFFKGLTASYIGCFEGAIQWVVYEKCKLIMKETATNSNITSMSTSSSKPQPLAASKLFLVAAFSKFVAISATYPHEVVRTRLREQSTNGIFRYSGFMQCISLIAKEEGMRGLYSGLGMHLIRSVPNAAIMFVTFEVVSHWLAENG